MHQNRRARPSATTYNHSTRHQATVRGMHSDYVEPVRPSGVTGSCNCLIGYGVYRFRAIYLASSAGGISLLSPYRRYPQSASKACTAAYAADLADCGFAPDIRRSSFTTKSPQTFAGRTSSGHGGQLSEILDEKVLHFAPICSHQSSTRGRFHVLRNFITLYTPH
jgi:hypothetical protein